MAASFNPQAAADQARNAYRNVSAQLGQLGLDTSVPEAVRAIAEKSVAQTREFYDRSNDALDASVATFEKTFDAAGQGAAAFNRKIIDIAQRNINSGFDLAKSLAGAKNLADIAEVQAAYWRKMFATLTSQAEEVRVLSTMVTAAAAEPIKAHVTNGMDEMRKVQTERLWASSEVQRTAQTRGLTKIVSPALARIIEGSLAGTQIEGDAP